MQKEEWRVFGHSSFCLLPSAFPGALIRISNADPLRQRDSAARRRTLYLELGFEGPRALSDVNSAAVCYR